MNINNIWNDLDEAGIDQNVMNILYTVHWGPYTTFQNVKGLLQQVSSDDFSQALENLMHLPSMEAGLDEDINKETMKSILYGDPTNEIATLTRVMEYVWEKTKVQKQNVKKFF